MTKRERDTCKLVQLEDNQMAFVIVVVFINIQLILDDSLPQGFPNQINEGFTKVNMFVMQ